MNRIFYAVATASFLCFFGCGKQDATDPFESKLHRAGNLLEAGNTAEAIAVLQESLQLRPDDLNTHRLLGWAYLKTEQFANANEHFNKAIMIESIDPETFYFRGTTLMHLGRHSEALRDFDKAIELAPNHVSAIVNRGIIKAMNNRLLQAISDFSRAIELDPSLAQAYMNRGQAYELLEQPDLAEADFEKVRELAYTQGNLLDDSVPFIDRDNGSADNGRGASGRQPD